MKELYCVVKGRVQGVMFRDFARRHAIKLGIVGTVENLADGSVEVVAQGEEEKLMDLLALIRKGPVFARVDDVTTKWRDPTNTFSEFAVLYRSFWDRL